MIDTTFPTGRLVFHLFGALADSPDLTREDILTSLEFAAERERSTLAASA